LFKICSLEAPFISAESFRGTKAYKKIPFFNVKIVRGLSGGDKKGDIFQKCFSNDDIGT
jgi:hypothetical protein